MPHIKNVLGLLLAALLILPATSINAQVPQHFARVTVDLSQVPGGVAHLLALGIAADHGERKSGVSITTDLSDAEQAVLQAHGIPFQVLIPDISAWYAAHAHDPAPMDAADRTVECALPADIPVPEHFTTGSMGGYYTWEEMIAILDSMAALHPDLISVKQSIGSSWEGRPLYMVRISNNPGVDQDKPEVLYTALHHAREPASLSQVIFYMWHVLENYGTDPEITWLVDHTEMYFVPCVNPDGYVFNETTSPGGGGMWRKNRRDNGDGTFGVDLNRNYGYEWGLDDDGSSPSTDSEVYRGPAAFSEPETQAVRDFCIAHDLRLALNYHTYGNLLIYPWGYAYSLYTADSAVFSTYGLQFAKDNHYLTGTGDQTVQYVTNGDSDDWMYGEQDAKPKILSMTPEAGLDNEGFWPPASRINAICKENVTQNLRMAHMAYIHGITTDRTPPVVAAPQAYFTYDMERLGQEQGPITVSVTPLDLVLSVGPAKTYSDMALLETRTDSIALTLAPGAVTGDRIRFVVVTDFGGYAHRDTLTKVVGDAVIALADNGSSLGNWTGSWGIDVSTYHTPPSCLSDSPSGPYPNNSVEPLDLAEPIDLSASGSAELSFWAKWDIEPNYDQVQVLASSNGMDWQPLCGIYTHAGSSNQSVGEPLYDGRRPDWVQEHMDLADFLGGPVHLRFQLRSDQFVAKKGFFLDDVVMTTSAEGPSAIPEHERGPSVQCGPNPASDLVRVRFDLPGRAGNNTLVVRNAVGSVMYRQPLVQRQGDVLLATTAWSAGVYFLSIVGEGPSTPVQRLVITK